MANTELGYDIQTGRNVYVDKDKYESDDAYKAKIDSYVNEGFKLVYGDPDEPSSEGGGGGGGAEPLVVIRTFDSDTESYTYGDTTFGEVRQAFESGKPVIIKTEGGATTNYDLVDGVSYTIESGNCSGSVMWYNGNVGVYGNDSTATLEELDVIILGTSLE